MRAENLTPLDAGRQALAAAYLPMARASAARFTRRCPGRREDFVRHAEFGLVKAAQRWRDEPVPGPAFARHAEIVVHRTLLNQYRSARAAERREQAVRRERAGGAPRDAGPAEAVSARIDAGELLGRLRGRERQAVGLIAAEGLTYAEAAARTGLDRSQLHRAYHRGVARLRAGA